MVVCDREYGNSLPTCSVRCQRNVSREDHPSTLQGKPQISFSSLILKQPYLERHRTHSRQPYFCPRSEFVPGILGGLEKGE